MSRKHLWLICLVIFVAGAVRGEEPYRPFGLEFGLTKAEIAKGLALPENFAVSPNGHGPYFDIPGIGDYFPDCPAGELSLYFGRELDRLWRVLWTIRDLNAADLETVTKRILARLKKEGFAEIKADKEAGNYLLERGDVLANLVSNPGGSSGTGVAFFSSELRSPWHRERLEHDLRWILKKLNNSSCLLYPGMTVRSKFFSLDPESGACKVVTSRVILKTTNEEYEEKLTFNLRDTDIDFEDVRALEKGILWLSFKKDSAFLQGTLSGKLATDKMVTRIALEVGPLEDARYCQKTLVFIKKMISGETPDDY